MDISGILNEPEPQALSPSKRSWPFEGEHESQRADPRQLSVESNEYGAEEVCFGSVRVSEMRREKESSLSWLSPVRL